MGEMRSSEFKRYGSARKLYNFNIDNAGRLLMIQHATQLQRRIRGLAIMSQNGTKTTPRKSATFDDYTLSEIRRAATTGIYDIRGWGAKRKLPHFDDLLFLGASACRATRSRATASAAAPTSCWARALPRSPST